MLEGLDAAALRERAAAVVIDLRTGATGGWRADEDIYPASIIKIALMVDAFRRFGASSSGQPVFEGIDYSATIATAEGTLVVDGCNVSSADFAPLGKYQAFGQC